MVIFLLAFILLNTGAFAQTNQKTPEAEVMAADLLVLKPLGFLTTTLGCVLFTAALPFTVWSKERISKAGKKFVVEPGAYTFVRPLGEFNENK